MKYSNPGIKLNSIPLDLFLKYYNLTKNQNADRFTRFNLAGVPSVTVGNEGSSTDLYPLYYDSVTERVLDGTRLPDLNKNMFDHMTMIRKAYSGFIDLLNMKNTNALDQKIFLTQVGTKADGTVGYENYSFFYGVIVTETKTKTLKYSFGKDGPTERTKPKVIDISKIYGGDSIPYLVLKSDGKLGYESVKYNETEDFQFPTNSNGSNTFTSETTAEYFKYHELISLKDLPFCKVLPQSDNPDAYKIFSYDRDFKTPQLIRYQKGKVYIKSGSEYSLPFTTDITENYQKGIDGTYFNIDCDGNNTLSAQIDATKKRAKIKVKSGQKFSMGTKNVSLDNSTYSRPVLKVTDTADESISFEIPGTVSEKSTQTSPEYVFNIPYDSITFKADDSNSINFGVIEDDGEFYEITHFSDYLKPTNTIPISTIILPDIENEEDFKKRYGCVIKEIPTDSNIDVRDDIKLRYGLVDSEETNILYGNLKTDITTIKTDGENSQGIADNIGKIATEATNLLSGISGDADVMAALLGDEARIENGKLIYSPGEGQNDIEVNLSGDGGIITSDSITNSLLRQKTIQVAEIGTFIAKVEYSLRTSDAKDKDIEFYCPKENPDPVYDFNKLVSISEDSSIITPNANGSVKYLQKTISENKKKNIRDVIKAYINDKGVKIPTEMQAESFNKVVINEMGRQLNMINDSRPKEDVLEPIKIILQSVPENETFETPFITETGVEQPVPVISDDRNLFERLSDADKYPLNEYYTKALQKSFMIQQQVDQGTLDSAITKKHIGVDTERNKIRLSYTTPPIYYKEAKDRSNGNPTASSTLATIRQFLMSDEKLDDDGKTTNIPNKSYFEYISGKIEEINENNFFKHVENGNEEIYEKVMIDSYLSDEELWSYIRDGLTDRKYQEVKVNNG